MPKDYTTLSRKPSKSRSTKTPKRDLGVKDRAGVKKEGATPVRIRSAEWAMKDAQRRANNRAKARKNPEGRIAKALEKKGYDAAKVNKDEAQRKRVAAGKASKADPFKPGAGAAAKAEARRVKKGTEVDGWARRSAKPKTEVDGWARRSARPKTDNRRSGSSRRYS